MRIIDKLKKSPGPSTKRTIYICIELKHRELNANLIFAFNAALRGYRIYVGSHAAIHKLLNLKKHKAGILIDKSSQPKKLVNLINSKCDIFCIYDVELTPIINAQYIDNVLETRMYPEVESGIDIFLCSGPIVYASAQKYFSSWNTFVSNAGWPLYDLWTSYSKKIYAKEIKKIREQYGNFLLFASGFRYLSDPTKRQTLKNPGIIKFNEKNTLNYKLTNYTNFRKTINLLKIWDSNPDCPPIVVRPHPSEDLRIWKREIRNMSKVYLENRFSVDPWIEACQGLIHAGSTTSLQARISNKNIFYLKDTSLVKRHTISSHLSNFIVDEMHHPFIDSRNVKVKNNPDFDKNILKKIIYFSNVSNCDNILDLFDDLKILKEPKISQLEIAISYFMPKSIKRMVGLIRDEVWWKLNLTNVYPQSHAMKIGITKKDIKKVKSSSSKFDTIRTHKIGFNLFVIDNKI